MIDPTTILAFSMHKYKGVYALLLGSGISRSASIPTGWEVVLDLTRQLARAQGVDSAIDPAAWYRETFGKEPDYAELLAALAKSPAERSQLLRPYFEPQDDEERRQGIKLPTPAHKAIARLVAHGHIRVIITTNFDRLLEQALEAEGVAPSVIATPDAVAGVLPLIHTSCTIVKVHGDYRDTRIRNTPTELGVYDPSIDRLLDRIFDEFGLIVCGWSADWDEALRAAIMRSPNHRFTTFWASRSAPKERAQELIAQRRAEFIRVADADAFFQGVEEQVTALDTLERPHPASAQVMAERVKRYIEDNRSIRLRDVVMGAGNDLRNAIGVEKFPVDGTPTGEDLQARLGQYEALSEVVLAAMIVGCYWSGQPESKLWGQCIEHLYAGRPRSGNAVWLNLGRYPALLTYYGAGIAAFAGKRYKTLVDLLLHNVNDNYGDRIPLVSALYADEVLGQAPGRLLPEAKGASLRVPTSEHLFTVLRKPVEELLYVQEQYEQLFNLFEYLLALVQVDLRLIAKVAPWGQPGRFAYNPSFDSDALPALEEELERNGKAGPLLRAGLFGGSTQRLHAAKGELAAFVERLGWHRL